LFQQEFAEAFGQEPKLRGGGGMRGEKHKLSVLEVGGPNFGGEFRREEFSTERRERADFERFGDNGLQIVVGREVAADSGKSHGGYVVRSGTCRLS
jgi:hypothetical protein